MSTVTEGKDYFRNFLHIELDKLLDQAPDFGYIEFHIALKNRLPVNIDAHINQALRIRFPEESQRPEKVGIQNLASSQGKGGN